jgi:hypothetical protein
MVSLDDLIAKVEQALAKDEDIIRNRYIGGLIDVDTMNTLLNRLRRSAAQDEKDLEAEFHDAGQRTS